MNRDLTFIPIVDLRPGHRISGAAPEGNEVAAVRQTAKRVYYTYRYTTAFGETRSTELFQDSRSNIAVRTASL